MYSLLFSLIFYGKYKLEEIAVILIVFVLFFFKSKVKVNKKKFVYIFLILSFLSFISFIKIYINSYPYLRFIEQMLILSTTIFGYFIIFENEDYLYLWEKYLTISFLFSLIGLLQFLFYFVFRIDFTQIDPNSHFLVEIYPRILRINPFSHEPGSFGQMLIPATIYYIINFRKNLGKGIVIILANLLTFSINTYFILLLYFLSKILQIKNLKKIAPIVPMFLIIVIKSKDFWYIRLSDSFNGLVEIFRGNHLIMNDINLSSFSIISSLYVSLLSKNYIFGTGIGTHPNTYFKYLPKDLIYYDYGNFNDAYSLLLRIFSEFGLIGLMFIVIFISYNYEKNNLINNCCFWGFIGFFLKGGSYTKFGILFFAILMIYSKVRFKKERL